MIPRELLKKIRQIEIRTNRLVSESVSGAYHSVFKGQGMNFDEVREYQSGDDVRAIDWNVTARMNHPFIKKYVEEREMTVMLLVDLSGSGRFGSGHQSKRELAAEIASVLAFSAIRNNDKVGLILFTDRVEKFVPPRKGRRHVLRVIREILAFTPAHTGTDLATALEFLNHVTRHRAVAVILSDFLAPNAATASVAAPGEQPSLADTARTPLRQAHRRHDVVAVQIMDPLEESLPDVGWLTLEDAETGEVAEVNLRDPSVRDAFRQSQEKFQTRLRQSLLRLGIDAIQLRTDQSYIADLGRFFATRERRRALAP